MILTGLVTAQIIASIHVHISNLELHDKMQVLLNAGYLTVPNAHVLPRLLGWKQAVLGGLFLKPPHKNTSEARATPPSIE